jgi:hypothetical protein
MKWSKAEQEQPELSCALPPWAIGHGMLSNDMNVDGGTETADNVTGHAWQVSIARFSFQISSKQILYLFHFKMTVVKL